MNRLSSNPSVEMDPIASPQVWYVQLHDQGQMTMTSLNDDTIENTNYHMIDHKFHYLSERQRKDMRWLLEQLYPVVVDEGEKQLSRQTFKYVAQDTNELFQTMNNDRPVPLWAQGIIDINETAKGIICDIRENKWEYV